MVCRTLQHDFLPYIGILVMSWSLELSRKMKFHLHPALETLLETILW